MAINTHRTVRLFLVGLLAALVASSLVTPAGLAQEAEKQPQGATASNCENPLAPRLKIGEQGSAIRGLRVRSLPQGEQIGFVRRGMAFDIVDGPRNVLDDAGDCLAWWYVYVYSLDLSGWVAEGWQEYWISPLAVAAVGRSAVVGAEGFSGAISGEWIRTDQGERVEWGVWQPDRGYIALGWTWKLPDGTPGCSVPEQGAPLSAADFCAQVRARGG